MIKLGTEKVKKINEILEREGMEPVQDHSGWVAGIVCCIGPVQTARVAVYLDRKGTFKVRVFSMVFYPEEVNELVSELQMAARLADQFNQIVMEGV